METHETRFGTHPDVEGWHLIRMTFSAKNAFGGRVKHIAIGRVRLPDTGEPNAFNWPRCLGRDRSRLTKSGPDLHGTAVAELCAAKGHLVRGGGPVPAPLAMRPTTRDQDQRTLGHRWVAVIPHLIDLTKKVNSALFKAEHKPAAALDSRRQGDRLLYSHELMACLVAVPLEPGNAFNGSSVWLSDLEL